MKIQKSFYGQKKHLLGSVCLLALVSFLMLLVYCTQPAGTSKLILPVYSISGKITADIPGGIISGASVQLIKDEIEINDPVLTDIDGLYCLTGVPKGTGYELTVYFSGYDVAVSEPFDVLDDVTNEDMVLAKTGKSYKINGIISANFPEGKIPGAAVQLKHDGSNIGSAVFTDDEGAYILSGLDPGPGYTISVTCSGYEIYSSYSFFIGYSDITTMNIHLAKLLNSYEIDDFFVWEDWAEKEELSGYRDYSGKVMKVSSIAGMNWGDIYSDDDYSRALYCDLNDCSGFYRITVSMSILAEKPQTRMYTGPSNIGWTMQNGFNSNGTIKWAQFGGPAKEIPYDEWVDLEFAQTVNIADKGERYIFIDGLNLHQGLIDLTLYIRYFKLTLEKITGSKYIALTFDDGPFDQTGELLDKLAELKVKATFFLNGLRIDALDPVYDAALTPAERDEKREERQAMVKRILDSGHDIGNHSYSHNYLGGGNLSGDGIDTDELLHYIPFISGYTVTDYPLDEACICKELEDTQTAIQIAVYGEEGYLDHRRVSNYFRTPFTSDPQYSVNLIHATEDMGLPVIYGIDSHDYFPGISAETIASIITNESTPWGVIIAHDPPVGLNILEALDIFVPDMRNQGFEFITISEMEEKRIRTLTPGKVYNEFHPDLP